MQVLQFSGGGGLGENVNSFTKIVAKKQVVVHFSMSVFF
jgi:hypothetical protein